MTVACTAQGQYVHPSLEITSNEIPNPHFNRDNYPVWTTWNGKPTTSSYTSNEGDYKYIGEWFHYSPLWNSNNWSTYVGNQFLRLPKASNKTGNFPLAGYNEGVGKNRILKMYGAQDIFTFANNTWPLRNNNNPDRSSGTTGAFSTSSGIEPRIISNAVSAPISTSSMADSQRWTRHEWTYIADVPDSATTATFGAQIRVAADDQLRQFNWGGMYCAQDVYGTTNKRYVNFFGVRDSTNGYVNNLPTGTVVGTLAGYNWNGLQISAPASGTDQYYFTPASLSVTRHGFTNQEMLSVFTPISYSFTLQSGTNRKMSVSMFFAEYCPYLVTASSNNTGAIQFFEPYLEFS